MSYLTCYGFGFTMSFHPFQGRPLFGLKKLSQVQKSTEATFPSLSGKTSIRTIEGTRWSPRKQQGVSIPFREDLYSDSAKDNRGPRDLCFCFHPFQGRPLFGRECFFGGDDLPAVSVSIPFREDLYSDSPPPPVTHQASSFACFHPFQGRPLFGLFMT